MDISATHRPETLKLILSSSSEADDYQTDLTKRWTVPLTLWAPDRLRKSFATCFLFFCFFSLSFACSPVPITTTKPMNSNYNGKNISQLAITTVTSSLRTLKYRFNEMDHQKRNIRLSCLLLSLCSLSLWTDPLIIYRDIAGMRWQTLTPDLLTGGSACRWWRKWSRLCARTPFMSV